MTDLPETLKAFTEATADMLAKAIGDVRDEAARNEEIRQLEHRAFMAETRELLADLTRRVDERLAAVKDGRDGADGQDGADGKDGASIDLDELQKQIAGLVEAVVQRSLPEPPSEEERHAKVGSLAAMELLKEFAAQPIVLDLPAPVVPMSAKAVQPQVNVTVENHIPRKSAERTTVTKHDENGRIAEFVRQEVEE